MSACKLIVHSKAHCFTNFKVYHADITRLKTKHIINFEESKPKTVNWAFWNEAREKHGNYNIVIDELHNIMHSRRAMTKFNTLMSTWVAQIRKVTGSSEKTHMICISQEFERVDIAVRDLAAEIMYCIKVQRGEKRTEIRQGKRLLKKIIPRSYIIKYHFVGPGCQQRYTAFRDFAKKSYNYRTMFEANPYFKYYDSYELLELGEEEYL